MVEDVARAKISLLEGVGLLHLDSVVRPMFLNVVFHASQAPCDEVSSGVLWRLDELESSAISCRTTFA